MLARPLFGSVVCFPFYLITVAQYYRWACIHATSGLLDLFHCSWASLVHFFLLGHPRPISFPQASSALGACIKSRNRKNQMKSTEPCPKFRFGFDFYFSQTEVSISVSSMYAPNWPKPNQIIYNIFYIIILYI